MNNKVKIILIVLISIIGIIVLDTIGARVLKKSPLISKKEKLDGNSYVNKGLLMDTFIVLTMILKLLIGNLNLVNILVLK